MALPKKKRLPGTALAGIVRTKSVASDGPVSLKALRDGRGAFRCAVVVPSLVAPAATRRNRIRRAYTEALRLVLKKHAPDSGWSCLLMVRTSDIGAPQELQRRILVLLQKSGIVSQ